MKKLPKAYSYIAYLETNGMKRYLGNQTMRNVTTDLDKQVAEGKVRLLMFRQKETQNYYKGEKLE